MGLTADRIIIPPDLVKRVVAHCLQERPFEACGILAGKAGYVMTAFATDNALRHPCNYEVERRQQVRALAIMRARGEELVAIYHSHPTSPAYPSGSDIGQAVHHPEAIRVIISLIEPAEIRAFLINNGDVQSVVLETPATAEGQWHDLRAKGPER